MYKQEEHFSNLIPLLTFSTPTIIGVDFLVKNDIILICPICKFTSGIEPYTETFQKSFCQAR